MKRTFKILSFAIAACWLLFIGRDKIMEYVEGNDTIQTVKEMVETAGENTDVISGFLESAFSEEEQEADGDDSLDDSSDSDNGSTDSGSADMEVHFIDVGQGDATLIICGEHSILIDAGENDKGTLVQNYLQKQGVESLDMFIVTHFDSDHCGGADVIITKFDIDVLLMSDFTKDTATCRDVLDAAEYKDLTYTTPSAGDVYTVGDMTVTIVAPAYDSYEDANNSSIGLIITYGDTSFLFTGDCEEEAESAILASGVDLDVDVYKCGHHGSKTSSCLELLEAASPTYAVISCGEDNSYGHPHSQTLNNLRSLGVEVFRTDEQGSVVAVSDGTNITWNCAPSETWQAGN